MKSNSLNKNNRKFKSQDVDELCEKIQSKASWDFVSLYGNTFPGENDLIRIVKILETLEVGEVNLSNTMINLEAAKAIGKMLAVNQNITEIYLSKCGLSDEEIKAFADALTVEKTRENSKKLSIDLEVNNIGVRGARALGRMLAINSDIAKINLFGCQLNDMSITAFAEELEKIERKEDNKIILNISFNDIGDQGAQAIAEMLKVNGSFELVDIANNDDIGDEGKAALKEVLDYNFGIEIKAKMLPKGIMAEIFQENKKFAPLYKKIVEYFKLPPDERSKLHLTLLVKWMGQRDDLQKFATRVKVCADLTADVFNSLYEKLRAQGVETMGRFFTELLPAEMIDHIISFITEDGLISTLESHIRESKINAIRRIENTESQKQAIEKLSVGERRLFTVEVESEDIILRRKDCLT